MHDPPWTDDLLDRMRLIGDPEADAVIQEIVEERGEDQARVLFNALTDKVDLPHYRMPEAIQNFLEHHRHLPSWTDRTKLHLAEGFFLDHGPHILLFLYHKSLPTLYACANGARVLLDTGRMRVKEREYAPFTRRVGETGKFVLEVMQPDGLAGEGNGIIMILKIRLIHAAIRHFVSKTNWEESRLGKPVNQEDLAITLMTFSVSMLQAMDRFELAYSEEEAEAWLHSWKVVGQLLGIMPELLPENPKQGRYLLKRILERQAAPSEAGTILTQALIAFVKEILPTRIADVTPTALMRFLLEAELADMLEISPKAGCMGRFIPWFVRKIFQLEERLDAKEGFLSRNMHTISRKLAFGMVHFFQQQANWRPRNWDRMQRKWEEIED